MYRRIPVLVVGLVLVSVARSDETLKCYMCTSFSQPGCDTDPKANNIEPTECTLAHMADWQQTVLQHKSLSTISRIFEVDTSHSSQQYQAVAPMACAKLILKLNKHEVTVRSCQTAKTETIDPCKTIQGQFNNDLISVEHCELCMEDACNSSIANSARILLVLLSMVGSVILGALYNGA
ncbi:uncharacterized protein LOC128876124 [Hylaeus volcanicus]|uniref:uncharacterized protein LOC128876124 n=1 Tax=Hylaeus volcanicus TaxID=313075 RepID=UPI0023B7A931|nr:uncharacterized protein LOC128876124 [Hylaeus volcanicus]